MEITTVRVSGSLRPAYLRGRSTELIMDVYRPARATATAPQLTLAPNGFLADLQAHGRRAGEGVPFAALYMSRGKKKLAALQAA